MGVPRLAEVVRECQLLENFVFKNDKLVIDGSSLMYHLYFDSELDQRHGGDYVGFKDAVCQFFHSLADCGIESCVVLDGGSDCSDSKWNALQYRFECKIRRALLLAESSPLEAHFLPPLTKDVFKQILHGLGVPFAQCFGEADPEIFALANTLACPVLSDDSDYYIYDLRAGFLPLAEFQWKRREHRHINTMRYMAANFCDHFEVDRVLLPVFASIAGNDYTRLDDRGMFLKHYDKSTPSMRWRERRLYSILHYLRVEQDRQERQLLPQELAVDNALAFVGSVGAEKDQMRTDLLKSIQTYAQPPACPLATFFQNATTPDKPEHLHVLPDWALRPLTDGKLTSFVVDVLRLKRMVLSPQVEDSSQLSGHRTARPIRQHLYGLLLGGNGGCVREYDRRGETLICEEVEPVLLTRPHLTPEEVFMEALGVPCRSLDTTPDRLKLPVCVIHFWQRHSTFPDHSGPSNHLYALLLGMVYGDLCRRQRAGQSMERMTAIKERGEKRSLDLGVAHAFSQWQCCLKESLHLNQLLRFPVPEPECCWLYCGPLVHQLVAELRGDESRALVAARSILEGDAASADVFNNLLHVYKKVETS